jgi:NADPH:quinone reductase-like Zn-dependent oxidoreductase
MLSYFVQGTGLDSLSMREVADPTPGPGEVLVGVRAVSLNYRDLMVAEGRYGKPLTEPMVPCSDSAGVVLAVGAGVERFAPGDRVMNHSFRHWPGGTLRREYVEGFIGGGGVEGVLAEQFCFPAVSLVRVPDHLTFAEAATLPIAGLTAWSALVPFGQTRPGDWVLAHGTGGVSIFCAQLARILGARVILSTSSEEKASAVRERYHVEATVNYRDPDWPKHVREITGDGADVIVDTAGGETLARSLAAANYAARVAVVGVLDGTAAVMDIIRILARQLRVGGIYMDNAGEFESFAKCVASSKLKPAIDRIFPFEDARGAYLHLHNQKHIGKVCIQVAE